MTTAFKKGLLWSLAISAVITSVSWLMLGINSPLNHGIAPDVYEKPIIGPFIIFNLPAGIIAVNLFGKHGPEWGYFGCIFLQWFSIGALLAVGLKQLKPNRDVGKR